jgi:tRNA (guanine-N7-)-methyltransferase
MRQRRKPWALPYLLEQANVVAIKSDNLPQIKIKKGTCLEIGVGKGGFINQLASLNPSINYIGIEVQPSVLAVAVKKTNDQKLTNVNYLLGDANYLDQVLPPSKLNKIYINFPDPWPKARHEKRRLTYQKMLLKYHEILAPNGEIILKTDNYGLYSYSLESFTQNGYIIITKSDDYQLEKDDVATEYETKFRSKGLKIHRIVAKRGNQ